MSNCPNELDWGDLGFFCSRETGHDGPHQHTEADNSSQRPFRVEWWDDSEHGPLEYVHPKDYDD